MLIFQLYLPHVFTNSMQALCALSRSQSIQERLLQERKLRYSVFQLISCIELATQFF